MGRHQLMFGFRKAAGTKPLKLEEAEDLLAQREDEELEASVRALQARSSASGATETGGTKEGAEPEPSFDAEIEWTEQQDVFRATPVDARTYLAGLNLAPGLPVRRGESLILVRKSARDAVQAHLCSDLQVELGGLLGGRVLFDAGLNLFVVIVEVALPALHGEGTAVSFSYTPAAWEAILPGWRQMHPDWTIVGSYHSHPGLGVFLSSTDRETQADVFPHDWQIALVADPIAKSEGYFMGISGKPCQIALI